MNKNGSMLAMMDRTTASGAQFQAPFTGEENESVGNVWIHWTGVTRMTSDLNWHPLEPWNTEVINLENKICCRKAHVTMCELFSETSNRQHIGRWRASLLHFQNPPWISRWAWSKSLVSQNVLKRKRVLSASHWLAIRFVTQTSWSPPNVSQGRTSLNPVNRILTLVKAFERKVPCMVACAFPPVLGALK